MDGQANIFMSTGWAIEKTGLFYVQQQQLYYFHCLLFSLSWFLEPFLLEQSVRVFHAKYPNGTPSQAHKHWGNSYSKPGPTLGSSPTPPTHFPVHPLRIQSKALHNVYTPHARLPATEHAETNTATKIETLPVNGSGG